ncbi:MAG: FixH family protein [Cyclobacteriaceae bacterium]|nr:FixH family protein [Cyclobacteriaceae bacterium]
MNWGKSIVLAFVLFALFIGSLVVVCLRQDIALVTTNYYDQELHYQQQLDRMTNAEQLKEKPLVQVVNGALEVQFSRLPEIEQGELELFRPSDAKLDRRYTIASISHVQRIALEGVQGGMYKAKLRWRMDGKDYYLERVIYL